VKSRLVLPFWYQLTRVVPDKGPLNGRARACECVCKTPENSTQDTPIRLELSSASHLSRVESRIWGAGLQQVPSRCSGRTNCYTVGIYFPEAGDLLHIATMQQSRPNWKRSKTFCSPSIGQQFQTVSFPEVGEYRNQTAHFRPHRMHSADVAYCYRRNVKVTCVCVCVRVCWPLGTSANPAKKAEPIRKGGQRNPALNAVYTSATWQIRWIDLCSGGDAACRFNYSSS